MVAWPQSSLFLYIPLLRHEATYGPFPWAHFIWAIYSNICLWKGDGKEKAVELFGDFQCKFWRDSFWSSITVLSCQTRLHSTRRRSRALLNKMAALKKSRIWSNWAQTGHGDHSRGLPWRSVTPLWLSQDKSCTQKFSSKIIPRLFRQFRLSLHIQFLDCFVRFVNSFRHE